MAIDKLIRKKGSVYRARFRPRIGLPRSRCFDRKVEAEAWLAKCRFESNKSSAVERRRLKFSELSELFLKNHARTEMAVSSLVKYEGSLRKYIVPIFSNLWIDEITKMQIVEFRALLGQKALSDNTKYFVFTAFKTVMKKALEWDLLDRNPADGVKAPRKGMPRTEYWKASEVKQFLDANRTNPHLPLYLIALNTGMRLGEILALKWDSVDLENGFITIQRIYCQKSHQIKETTKTQRARQIGINPVLHSLFVGLMQKSTSDFVLEGKRMRRGADHFSRTLAKACEKANVRPIKFHDLRHTYATQFVMNGGSIHALSGTLGHTSSVMTSRYAHYGPEHAKKAAQVVAFDVPESGTVLHFNSEQRKSLNKFGHKMVTNH